MVKALLSAGVVAALVVGVPAKAANPNKPLRADQLPAGKYVGVVQTTPGKDRALTIQMDYQKVEVNQQALQRLNANVQRQYQQVLRLQQQLQQEMMRPGRSSNQAAILQQLQRAIAQLQAAQAGGGQGVARTVTETADVDFQLTPDVKVRLQEPPQEFDDKGNVKKFTPSELREMKGKYANLPGYPTILDNLEKDQKVELTLVDVRKSRPGPPPKDAKAAAAEQTKQVNLILILNSPAANPAAGAGR